MEESKSPVPPEEVKVEYEKKMDFPTALKEVIEGKKITKIDWDNRNINVFLKDDLLTIAREDGTLNQLIISREDIIGEDWVISN